MIGPLEAQLPFTAKRVLGGRQPWSLETSSFDSELALRPTCHARSFYKVVCKQIGMWAIRSCGFDAAAFIGYARLQRPGSIIGPQQQFLVEHETELLKLGGWPATGSVLKKGNVSKVRRAAAPKTPASLGPRSPVSPSSGALTGYRRSHSMAGAAASAKLSHGGLSRGSARDAAIARLSTPQGGLTRGQYAQRNRPSAVAGSKTSALRRS